MTYARVWPKAGNKMRFLGENGYPFELEEAHKLFQVGKIYTVVGCNVEDWSHSVQFQEVDGHFNGVMFECVDVQDPSIADQNRKDAEEFCKGAFGPFVRDVSQYTEIVAKLLQRASDRAASTLSPQDCRADVIHECIDIVRKYDDTGASFIIEKLQALALAPKGAA